MGERMTGRQGEKETGRDHYPIAPSPRRPVAPSQNAALKVIFRRRTVVLLVVALAALAGSAAPARAQRVPADTLQVDEDAEQALDDLDTTEGEGELLVELLTDLARNPLNLNTASADELSLIPAFSPIVAQNIVAFRERFGPFGAVAEVRSVEGVTGDTYEAARPYLRADPPPDPDAAPASYPAPPSFGEIISGLQGDVIQRYTRRLDLGRGYEAPAVRRVTAEGDTVFTTTYAGSPARIYTRLRVRYERRVSLNLTLDKDPGEAFRWRPARGAYGYDHVSAHAAIRDFGRLRTLIVGDYTAEFGQGVALWRGLSFSGGRNAVQTVARSGRGLVPYGSTEENRFFRGVAGTFLLTPELALSTFVSLRTLDANVITPDTTQSGFDGNAERVRTLTTTGLHRTPSERARKDALGEALYGSGLEYTYGASRLGVVAYHARFDTPLVPDTTQPFRRFQFAGASATTVSLYGQLRVRDLLFFGEAVRAPTGVLGGTGGLLMRFGRTAEAVVKGRYFPRNFVSPHGSGGGAQNEMGLYVGLRLKPARAWTLNAYVDQYRYPWIRFAVPRPSTGYDARLVIAHEPRPWLDYYLQLRTQTRETGAVFDGPGGSRVEGLQEETRQSARLHADYAFSDELRLRSRVEAARYRLAGAPAEYGFILYQDVRWRPFAWAQIDARLAFFDTDSYDARVYAYENDLLYAFSVPAFSGQGQRAYALLRLEPTSRLTVQVKYGVTRYRDVETVGSGLDELEGTRLREIRAQVRWTF